MTEPRHIVLAGDSIFDNDPYVQGRPSVIQQLRKSVPAGWSAYKKAVDGDCIKHVLDRLFVLPAETTDLILSIGGNDMLGYSHLLGSISSVAELPEILKKPRADIAGQYGHLLDGLAKKRARVTVCTVYTAIPFPNGFLRELAPAAIAAFNDVIMEAAAERGRDVIRLDEICTEREDFSAMSPIEPSSIGGQKIVDAIVRQMQGG